MSDAHTILDLTNIRIEAEAIRGHLTFDKIREHTTHIVDIANARIAALTPEPPFRDRTSAWFQCQTESQIAGVIECIRAIAPVVFRVYLTCPPPKITDKKIIPPIETECNQLRLDLVAGPTAKGCWEAANGDYNPIDDPVSWRSFCEIVGEARRQSGSTWAIVDAESLFGDFPHVEDFGALEAAIRNVGMADAKIVWNPMRIRPNDSYLTSVFYHFYRIFTNARFMDVNMAQPNWRTDGQYITAYSDTGALLAPERRISRGLFKSTGDTDYDRPYAVPNLLARFPGEWCLWADGGGKFETCQALAAELAAPKGEA